MQHLVNGDFIVVTITIPEGLTVHQIAERVGQSGLACQDEFEKAAIHELSGGMRQRAALARALAPDPKILLIDEPFPGLDALVRAKLYAELQEILIRTRKTILSVTHDPNEAACLGDRVFVFTGRPGRIKAEIPVNLPRPREITDPQLAQFSSRIMAELGEGPKT